MPVFMDTEPLDFTDVPVSKCIAPDEPAWDNAADVLS
jgi:hypothetical protein